jgi:hypothetical protein
MRSLSVTEPFYYIEGTQLYRLFGHERKPIRRRTSDPERGKGG